jgi:glucokinase
MANGMSGPPILGIDLGGTKILAAVVTARHEIIGRAKRSTPAHEGGDELMAALLGAARDAIAAAGLAPADIAACGVGSPGPLDLERGIILKSANLNVKDFPLGPGLATLGFPVRVWNDVRVGGYGEFRLGAGRGYRNLIAAFVGTGVGGCLILDGQIVEGSTHNAGEIGHIVVKAGGARCGCGQRGCMEAYASRTAITRRIARAVERGQKCKLEDHFLGSRQTRVKSKELAGAYFDRDTVVVREIERAARFLGITLAGQMNFVGPELVIIGGGVVAALGEPYLKIVREAAGPHILADPQGAKRIVAAKLGDDSSVLGAALLAREAFSPQSVSLPAAG